MIAFSILIGMGTQRTAVAGSLWRTYLIGLKRRNRAVRTTAHRFHWDFSSPTDFSHSTISSVVEDAEKFTPAIQVAFGSSGLMPARLV